MKLLQIMMLATSFLLSAAAFGQNRGSCQPHEREDSDIYEISFKNNVGKGFVEITTNPKLDDLIDPNETILLKMDSGSCLQILKTKVYARLGCSYNITKFSEEIVLGLFDKGYYFVTDKNGKVKKEKLKKPCLALYNRPVRGDNTED